MLCRHGSRFRENTEPRADSGGMEGHALEKKLALQMRGITKRFGPVLANNHVDLDVCQGEILAILGENGSGKTTLMNMLAGIYFPDEGHILINGQEVVIRSRRMPSRGRSA